MSSHPSPLSVLLPAATLLALVSCGSVSNYREIPKHRLATDTSDSRERLTVEQETYVAFKEEIEQSPNVRSVTRMTDLRGDMEPGDFTIFPNGSVLAYSALALRDPVPYANLWLISTQGGSAATKLTAGRYFDTDPVTSPEGTEIYFASNRTSALTGIWRVRADGAGGLAMVTPGTAMDASPSPTAQGDGLFYTSRPVNADADQIWRIQTNGNLPTQIRLGWRPRVSSDGGRVLFSAADTRTGRSQIWVMNADGTNQTQLSANPEANDVTPSWSPDGKRIAFASDVGRDNSGQQNHDIWVMNVDGASITQLTTNGSTDMAPQFSPDGRFVYFLSNRGFHWNIWRMEIVDTAAR